MCEFTGMNSKMNSYIWILTYDFIIFIMFMNSFPNSYYTFTAAYGPRPCDFCFPCFESLHGEGSAAKRKPICQTLRNIRVTWTPRNRKTAIWKFGRPKYVIMGNNRTRCNNDVVMSRCNNKVIMETASLHKT